MLRYAAGRLAALALTLAWASAAVFVAVEVVPGDPAAVMLGTGARPDTVAALRAELGLDAPAPERYLAWVGGLLRGDLGTSYTYRTPVADLVAERLWVSLPLAGLALALAAGLGLPGGLAAAWAAGAAGAGGRALDAGLSGAARLGIAVPSVWLAMLLVGLFAIRLRWFPAGGFPGWEAGLGAGLRALALPALALALPQAAILARVLRGALLEAMAEEFVRAARAKGLSRAQALRRHALRHAMVAVLTILGLQLSFLLAGAIIVEQVFALPGLGRLVFQSVAARDLIAVEGTVMVLVLAVVAVNFAVDLACAAADPRLRARLRR